MIDKKAKETLKKQKYELIGKHSAVKTCGWTKKMIRDGEGCYKLVFYGINSHQCLQMTTSMSCANRCTFCWRGYKAPVSKKWIWEIDNPLKIIEESLQAQKKLLIGLKGYKKNPNNALYKQSLNPKHVALSLTGEPIIYPKINELIDEFHKKKISTFLVTNAQYPEQIKNLHPVTQLYLSLDAPNKKLLKEIDKPIFEDYWERLNKSLEILSKIKYRTTIRLTIIKDINDIEPQNYATLIKKGNPDFIEAKGYMHVGQSTKRLKFENMPFHEEVVKFSKELKKYLEDYEIISEHVPSRVTLLAKKKFKKNKNWFTWIDFDKFFQFIEDKKEIMSEDFLRQTPKTGLSGKTTKERSEETREKSKKF